MRKSADSLRAGGVSTLSLDQPTKAVLRQLAGDMPVSHYVRALAHRELAKRGGTPALPGQEKIVSEATLPAISNKLDSIMRYVFSGQLDDTVFKAIGMPSDYSQPSDMDRVIAHLEKQITRLKAIKAMPETALFDMNLEGERA
ncbi:hypothetical protein ACFLXT_04320 [Chloroflexota bacterium]